MSAIQKVLGFTTMSAPDKCRKSCWVGRGFRHFRIAIATGVAIAVTVGAPAAPAHAAAKTSTSGSRGSTTTASPMTLSSQSTWFNPYTPPWCLTEDDYDHRLYAGSLNGSTSTTEQLCGQSTDTYNGYWYDAGGIGLESDIYVPAGQLTDLTITAPDGTVHHAVLMGQTTSKGATTDHYAVCFVPYYSTTSDTAGQSLPGGSWQITLSGQISNANWYVNAQMTDVTFQRSYCPTSEQNLGT